MSKCSLEGCEHSAYRRGMCYSHYYRTKQYGDPLAGRKCRSPNGAPLAWLIERSQEQHSQECLLWPFARNNKGYGCLVIHEGQQRGPHNIMCRLVHGEPPEGQQCTLHSCHNPQCVNPRHLRWGSHQENNQDRVLAGRSTCGERHLSAKFDECAVRLITLSKLPADELAQFFRVNKSTIARIKNGKNWKHLRKENQNGV